MTDSIREQILTAFGERLAVILKTNQYNSNMGKTVLRSQLPAVSSTLVPCIGFNIGEEDNTDLYNKTQNLILPVTVQGIENFTKTDPAIKAELLYADIHECILGFSYSLGIDSGGTNEISAGDTIIGEDSEATALVTSNSLDSGTWAGGDAAGTLTLRRLTGWFQDDEDLSVGTATGQATVDGTLTGQGPIDLVTAGLADQIGYFSGSIKMPEEGAMVVGVQLLFNVRYELIAGNPYSQTN